MNREIDPIRRKHEARLIEAYRKALKNIRAEMLKIEERYRASGAITATDARNYIKQREMIKQIYRELDKLGEEVRPLIQSLQSDVLKEGYYRTTYEIDKGTGFAYTLDNATFARIPTAAVEAITQNDKFLDSVADLRRKEKIKVKNEITQGIIQGKSIANISKGIKSQLDLTAARALRIARTETQKAMNYGALAATDLAEENGVKLKKVWVATLDDRTRETHQEMDGQEADEEGLFHLPGGLVAEMPMDDSLPAEEVINCRCTYINRIEGYEPATRAARNKIGETVQIEYKTYRQWAESKNL